MARRIALFASVLLAGVVLAAASGGAAPSADGCLAKPKNPSPSGKHWYYRTDRTIQRKCWYLGDEGANPVAVTPPKQSASAIPRDPGEKFDSGPKIDPPAPTADARAELIVEPRTEQPAVSPTQPQPEAMPGAPDGATTRNGVVALRWPDASAAFAVNQATTVNAPSSAYRTENSFPVLAADSAAPMEQPSVALGAADDVSFVLPAAALLLFVIAGGAIFIFFASRRSGRRSFSGQGHLPPRTHLDEMPWTRSAEAIAARPASVVGGSRHDRLSDEIERMDQLLAIARQTRGSR